MGKFTPESPTNLMVKTHGFPVKIFPPKPIQWYNLSADSQVGRGVGDALHEPGEYRREPPVGSWQLLWRCTYCTTYSSNTFIYQFFIYQYIVIYQYIYICYIYHMVMKIGEDVYIYYACLLAGYVCKLTTHIYNYIYICMYMILKLWTYWCVLDMDFEPMTVIIDIITRIVIPVHLRILMTWCVISNMQWVGSSR